MKNSTYIPLRPMKVPRKQRINRPKKAIVAVDWDGTVVDNEDQFLPGAVEALKTLLRRNTVIIHSCRGNYFEGALLIKEALASAGITSIEVWAAPGKPIADIYIDDRGYHFTDWTKTLNELQHYC